MLQYLYLALLFLSMALAACSTKPAPDQTAEVLLPLPEEYAMVKDPSDHQLKEALRSYLSESKAPLFTRYEFTRLDLNNDTRREAIVLMKTPYQYWCGLHGCKMAIFEAHNDGFELISEIVPVRGPLHVTEENTNGWRDIVVRLSGRPWEAKNVVLRYDGSTYPADPETQPVMAMACNSDNSIKIFP